MTRPPARSTRWSACISDIGYEVPLSKIDLLVLGMTPGHCDIIIGDALRAEPGVRVGDGEPGDGHRLGRVPGVAGQRGRDQEDRSAAWATRCTTRARARTPWTASGSCGRREVRRQLMNMLIAWPLGAIVMLGTFSNYEPLKGLLPAFMAREVVPLPADDAAGPRARDGSSSSIPGTGCGAASRI